ncbi:hypothetical protein DICPUDRAFT_35249 [Dictyostelium purpureum]|uniref:Dolichyl-phosphate beta-glucosyltransferase n=1 Tax=Dictyostelium purpureum TaxID=5786 RepID=F0ZP33_DICPU|nr:uncharacterized protein DICPUDRAFT_35249 [Dictyostelium purpureum]EGC34299.1 hypothetical protein DICPUDRAFT_35249 [Dictyostelium purpureum]|eukprot:XP_003289181.1 hypothetical protein DICPUDRAFT_35249 [Dictyostelium purpureum]
MIDLISNILFINVFSVPILLVLLVLIVAFSYYLLFLQDESILWLENENIFVDPKKGEEHKFPSIMDKNIKDDNVYLSIVIPAYNEEVRLPKMLDETLKFLNDKSKKELKFTYEIIIVDDGSKDNTAKLVTSYIESSPQSNIRLLKLKKNRGKGGAVKRGVLCSRGKYILMVDADGATDFKDFNRVEDYMKKIEKNENGIVCGSRSHLVDSDLVAKRSLLRNVLMYGFHIFVETLCVKGIKDTQCGFKLFTRETSKKIFPTLHIERWAFDVEILYLAQKLNIPIAEVAVNWTEIDGSKLDPFSSSIQMAKDILRIRMRYLLGIWKIKSSK